MRAPRVRAESVRASVSYFSSLPKLRTVSLAIVLEVFDAQLRVGVLPSGLELAARGLRLARLVLRFEGFPESVEGATVATVSFEVCAKDRLGFRSLARAQEQTAERFTRRQKPRGRLVVRERIFGCDRRIQQFDCFSVVAARGCDASSEHAIGDLE